MRAWRNWPSLSAARTCSNAISGLTSPLTTTGSSTWLRRVSSQVRKARRQSVKNHSVETPTAAKEEQSLATVGLYFTQCMDKVCATTNLQGLTAQLSAFQMDRMHPLLGSTVGFSVIQMDTVDRRHPLQGFTVGVFVIPMNRVYPPTGLQNFAIGFYFLPSIGVYSIQMAWPLSLSCRDPLRARRQPSCRDHLRARRRQLNAVVASSSTWSGLVILWAVMTVRPAQPRPILAVPTQHPPLTSSSPRTRHVVLWVVMTMRPTQL